MRKLRLALLSGGKSSEREVSLKSGGQVFEALDKAKYDIYRYDPQTDLRQLINDAPNLDVALIIMHGRWGEDGTIQGLLDLLGLPYQGSGVMASALAMNKELSKTLYRQAGLKVPRAVFFSRQDAIDPRALEAAVGLPAVIKPVNEGSSIGVTVARHLDQLGAGIGEALAYDRRVLVEEFISGMEVTAGVLGNDALLPLPLVEIVPDKSHPFFNYEAKYLPGATEEIVPARLSPEMTIRVQECGLTAHRALGCWGYSRTDTIVRDGEIYVLETNTIPGMTATSLFPQAARAMGLDFPALLDRLVELALEK
ncbi:D-alanine--D-alanine ligase family protein [Desulfobacca acetoxidans]|uniref:D-alanine--D-alanine ligase n=1 Tax=Desulfobacca acetoxidans (strain ATCC 700848 / DSM 11109 / ASRB2) TaxID=880072 RepID=F2NFY1_DESAR|nr:D-alanine--D-alanine ligase [Desulfobacca acetoxidans]AEB08394.1 D-alanine--D-alanine ligase [Desulfobacca acetoxidans DSM 11109]